MNLYEIDSAILELLDEETGEVLNVEAFEELVMEREKKIENIALYIKNLESDAAQIRAEEKSLSERRKSAENKADNLRAYLAAALGENQKFETPRVKLSWRKSSAVQFVIPEQDFIRYAAGTHDELLNYSEPTVNKKAITDAIKSGVELVGVGLVERNNLQIK